MPLSPPPVARFYCAPRRDADPAVRLVQDRSRGAPARRGAAGPPGPPALRVPRARTCAARVARGARRRAVARAAAAARGDAADDPALEAARGGRARAPG